MRVLTIVLLMAIPGAAQTPIVNLGRLPIARVFAMSEEGPYGAQKAFDGGSDAWKAGPGEFVIVRFARPVTVSGIVVGLALNWPERFTVQMRSLTRDGAALELFASPPVEISGARTVFATPRPVANVREVMLTFQSKEGCEVEEIEILGPAPLGVDLTPTTPLRDSRVAQDISAPAQEAFIRTLAAMEIAGLRKARAVADRATDSERKAKAFGTESCNRPVRRTAGS